MTAGVIPSEARDLGVLDATAPTHGSTTLSG